MIKINLIIIFYLKIKHLPSPMFVRVRKGGREKKGLRSKNKICLLFNVDVVIVFRRVSPVRSCLYFQKK